jgi:hypothetical protein
MQNIASFVKTLVIMLRFTGPLLILSGIGGGGGGGGFLPLSLKKNSQSVHAKHKAKKTRASTNDSIP